MERTERPSSSAADGPPAGDDLHEAFDLVSSEARFDILRSLWKSTTDGEPTVSFSTLREMVGMRDSGQFNYHLDKLRPAFIRKSEDGYELTYAGKQVIGAAVSGVYTDADPTSVDPMRVGPCPECGGDLEGRYEDGEVVVECLECSLVLTDGLPAPPIIVATHDEADLPAAFSRYVKTQVETLNQGFCSLCGAGVDRVLTRLADDVDPMDLAEMEDGDDETEGTVAASDPAEAADGETEGQEYMDVTYRCRACGQEVHGVIGTVLASEPVVAAFLHDAGVDIGDRLVWEFDWLFDVETDLISEDPVRVEATIVVDDERLVVTLDEHIEIVDSRRE